MLIFFVKLKIELLLFLINKNDANNYTEDESDEIAPRSAKGDEKAQGRVDVIIADETAADSKDQLERSARDEDLPATVAVRHLTQNGGRHKRSRHINRLRRRRHPSSVANQIPLQLNQ